MTMTIKKLKLAGFKVSVRRHRVWNYYQPKVKALLLQKHEIPEDVERKRRSTNHPAHFRKNKTGWYMEAKGGTTQVTITSPEGFFGLSDEVIAQGESICMDVDFFNKKEGRNRALGKAIAQFKKITGIALTPELLNVYTDHTIKSRQYRRERSERVIDDIRSTTPPAFSPGQPDPNFGWPSPLNNGDSEDIETVRSSKSREY